MKKRYYRIIVISLLLTAQQIFPQLKGSTVNFNDGTITGFTADHPRTFQLTNENNSLKINYTRTSSSEMWDNFNYTLPQTVNIAGTKLITVKVKSNINASLSFKPVFDSGDQYMSQDIKGDNLWHSIAFKVDDRANFNVTKVYMYIDGGTTKINSGIIYFDDLRFGDSAYVDADWSQVEKAIMNAEKLFANSIEGTDEGNFPLGSKSILQSTINSAKSIIASGNRDQKVADNTLWNLLDAMVTFETKAKSLNTSIIDQKATKETRYLYLNLQALQKRFVLYGMHDYVGYGVGWSGDNNRSDVKSVVGDFPAVLSEDLSGTDSNPFDAGKDYRLTSAYNRGGVVTICWHQKDPLGRGFYASNVNNENIVATLLPGGAFHKFYKDRLKTSAIFFKALRGSKGENIPVIFRPYHEHTGAWFWWGSGQCSIEQYNSLWQFTVNYLRDSLNVHNLLYAISPSNTGTNTDADYEKIYPGNNFIDVIGGDFYYSSPAPESEINNFSKFLRIVAKQAQKVSKVGALTEVGQEALKNSDWYSKYLLNPIKNDTLANSLVYAAVWRNASSTHFYAPYPGHSSVPDFINFYNDAYTLFEKDLPQMYQVPASDKAAPVFISKHDTVFVSPSTTANIIVETNERSFLKYDERSLSYDEMKNPFTSGGGSFKHTALITSKQGELKTIYIHAMDLFGNKTTSPLVVRFKVDTMQTPIAWSNPVYPTITWSKGNTPLGTDANSTTKINSVRSLYARRELNLTTIPAALAITVASYGGAEITVNGFPSGRYNLSSDAILDYNTEPISGNAFTKTFILDKTALSKLIVGNNTIGVEIHMPAGKSVGSLNVQVINQDYKVILPFGSEWLYYDKGNKPKDVTRGSISFIAENILPDEFKLYQNYPNPFNPTTVISYKVQAASHVTLKVYDVLGNEISTLVNEIKQPGNYSTLFTPASTRVKRGELRSSFASGVFFYRLTANGFSETKKMILLK